CSFFFFLNDPFTTQFYTLSLHDALPISTELFPEPERPVNTLISCFFIFKSIFFKLFTLSPFKMISSFDKYHPFSLSGYLLPSFKAPIIKGICKGKRNQTSQGFALPLP